jgi:cytochrome c biogenesis protein CcdA
MNFIWFLILTALLDCLNPATIVTQLILLIKTKSVKLASVFVASTFFTYLATGILIYYGIASPIKEFIKTIHIPRNNWFIVAESILAIAGITYLFFNLRRKDHRVKAKEPTRTKPFAILLLGMASTLSDVPTALPYLAFISKMELQHFNLLSVIIYFIFYTLIYILPMLIIQFIFTTNKSIVVDNFSKIEHWVDVAARWLLRLIVLLIIGVLIMDVLMYIADGGSVWQMLA